MKYRREIDGLRAVAVLPVIFFHAGFAAFAGGYVGVDIFFVISGYLITTIILSEMEAGIFSLTKFYERRARRILPALFVVMSFCLICGWNWLIPYELENFSQSLAAVSVFSSNVFFWLRSGYFSSASELKPLLHTWSLAVEEQYYVLFPLFLMVLWRFRKRWIFGSLVIVSIASLGLAQWGAHALPSAAFYLLPSRFWEIAIGALLAFVCLYQRHRVARITGNNAINNAGSLFGGALIILSVCWLDKNTPFPSFYALIPTVGTGLIILFAQEGTIVGRFLGSKVMVGLGLISYSIYLWHQPLFAFARHRTLGNPSEMLLLGLAMLSIVLAYGSWRYVEVPFRNRELFGRKRIFTLAAIGSLGFGLIGLAGHVNAGFPLRRAAAGLPEDYYAHTLVPIFNVGLDGKKCASEQASLCNFYKTNSGQNYLLLGDSHSADYSAEFLSYVKERNVNGWQMSVAGCGMFSGKMVGNDKECVKAAALLKETLKKNHYDKILYAANLNGYVRGLDSRDKSDYIESFNKFIEEISQPAGEVVIFAPRHALNVSSPAKYAINSALNDIHIIKEDENIESWSKALRDLKTIGNVSIFDQNKALIAAGCGDANCFNGHDKGLQPLYRDSNHLSNYGAQLMWRESYSVSGEEHQPVALRSSDAGSVSY